MSFGAELPLSSHQQRCCRCFGTHHPAAVHGPLGALPALRLRLRHLTDGKNDPCGSWALFPPVRCRTHACTPTTGAQPDGDGEEREERASFLIAAVSSVEKKTSRSGAAGSRVWLMLGSPPPPQPRRSGSLFPQQDRVAGRTDPQQLPLHPSREESHLQPLLKAEREAPPSSAERSRVRRIQREPTAKQVVTH